MKQNIFFEALVCCLIMNIFSCSSESSVSSNEEAKIPINISTAITSRATDDVFEAGDKIGIYVVNRNSDGSAATLKAKGNHVDNSCYTYNGTWTPDKQLYWKDNTTHADFYMYYPYTVNISNVEAMPFDIKADQSQKANYMASDLMIGKTMDVAPTDNAIMIDAHHAMSQAVVTLVAGNGFTDKMLTTANINVSISGVKISSVANIATGKVEATGNSTSVQMLNDNGKDYRAIIVPQGASQNNIITVEIDGAKYYLQRSSDFTAFVAGKSHKFTVMLSKTNNGVNVGITRWENDGFDYGGTAEQD